MNVERLAEEYIKRKQLLDSLTKEVNGIKDLLVKAVDENGTPDEKGHIWLSAGKYTLQRQKRQGKKFLDRDAAEQWAKKEGFWDTVKVVREELDEDALLGYVYVRRSDVDGIEDTLQSLYITPEPTWAFQTPVEQEQYDY